MPILYEWYLRYGVIEARDAPEDTLAFGRWRMDAMVWKMTTRTVLVAGLATAALLAAVGIGLSVTSESDDDVPGVPLPASPVVGTLDTSASSNDWDDVYTVALKSNERLTVRMTGQGDFDLWVLKPGTPEIDNGDQLRYVVASSQTSKTSSETVSYPAYKAGIYYLDVFANDAISPNAGSYTLTWSIERAAPPSVETSAPSVLSWGAVSRIECTATAQGAPLVGAKVLWQRRPAGTTKWTTLNLGADRMPTSQVDAGGRFSKGIAPTRATEYRYIIWPTATTGWKLASPITVTPRVSLSAPRVSTTTKYSGRSFKVWGYLYPRHKADTRHVVLTARKGSTVVRKTTLNYDYVSKAGKKMTKYVTYLTLPSKGTWTVTASTPADGAHAATSSTAMTVVVR